jgi:hypothetical protein
MSEPKPTAAQCQQAAMKDLNQADALVISCRIKLEVMSPFMKNAEVYSDLLKLSQRLNEVLSKINGLSI